MWLWLLLIPTGLVAFLIVWLVVPHRNSSMQRPRVSLVSPGLPKGNALDETGLNSGEISAGVAMVPGRSGTAFRFDGIRSHITFPASDALNVGTGPGMTFAVWINPETLGMQAIGEWNDGNGHEGANLWISVDHIEKGDGVGNLYANLYDTNRVIHGVVSRRSVIKAGVWQHVAVTYDRGTAIVRLYRDRSVVHEQYLGPFIPQTSYDFHLGYRASGPFSGTYFCGLMEQPGLYNRAVGE